MDAHPYAAEVQEQWLQGYLAHKKTPPPMTRVRAQSGQPVRDVPLRDLIGKDVQTKTLWQ